MTDSSYTDDSSYDDNVTPAPPVETKPYKAIAAFVTSFVVLLIQALDPSAAHHPVTWQEWLVTLLGALVTAGGVYQVTNPAKGLRRRVH